MPNITGDYGQGYAIELWSTFYPNGAFSDSKVKTAYAGDNATQQRGTLNFNASRSNAIYGNSDTVQPNSLTAMFCIKY